MENANPKARRRQDNDRKRFITGNTFDICRANAVNERQVKKKKCNKKMNS